MEQFASENVIVEVHKEKAKKSLPEKQPKHAKYFEGELQLRNINDEIMNYIFKKIDAANASIPEVTEFSDKDLNFKITSKKLAHRLGQELKKKFGGELKESEQLFSQDHQTGKEIFRLNVFFRKYPFDIGNFIEYKNEALKIRGFDKNKVKAENLVTKTKTQIDVKEIKLLEKHNCQVTQVEPKTYVLDKNYQNIEVINGAGLKINQKIKCVFIKGKAYLC